MQFNYSPCSDRNRPAGTRLDLGCLIWKRNKKLSCMAALRQENWKVLHGDVKVNFKPVALLKFYNTTKSQIPSTKSQINPKFQHSMTKTFAKIEGRHDVKSGEPGMMPLGATVNGPFVWIFEFGSLRFV